MEKVYKLEEDNNINMLPGDPKGLPDESLSFEKTLVFIDEAFLSKLSKSDFDSVLLERRKK